MKTTGANSQRDALLTVAVQGGAGLREALREFRPEADWTYFEKDLRLPDGLADVIVVVSFEGRAGKVEVKELRLTPADAPVADFTLAPAGASKFPWLVKDRAYRLRGRIAKAEAGAPVWADFDFRRLLLATGTRVPPDPASVVVLGIDGQGRDVRCPAVFDQAIGDLAEDYVRNGTLKWRAAAGVTDYEIYFNTAGPEGPRPLVLAEPLGIGELLTHHDSTCVPLWAGWPGVGLEALDADGNGTFDLLVDSTDGGRFLARNAGTNAAPLFLPRARSLPSDGIATSEVHQKVTGDWSGTGSAESLTLQKIPNSGPGRAYINGVTATIQLNGQRALRTRDGKVVTLDDATWGHLSLGDLDGDGRPDLAAGSARNDLLLLLNRSSEGPGVVEPHPLDFGIFKAAPAHSSDVALKPTIFDWNGDGKNDLLVTAWSGGCHLFLNESKDGALRFSAPQKLLQRGGALSVADSPVPWIVDWDGDGVPDLLAGDVSGRLTFFRNAGSTRQPDWQAGQLIADENGEPFCLTPLTLGAKRPVQGPPEWNWGYLSVVTWDLDGDGDLDLITNDSLGNLSWIENKGTRSKPRLARPRPFTHEGKAVRTPWRNAPGVHDWDGDGYPELLVLDAQGNLIMLHLSRATPGVVSRIEPMLDAAGKTVPINSKLSPDGVEGRSNLAVGDVDGDGKPDVLVGYSSYYIGGGNFLFCRNVGTAGEPRFETAPMRTGGGRLVEWTGSDGHDQWHNGGVCLFDWDGDGKLDLFHGVESGRFAYYANDYLNRKDFPVFETLEFSRRDAAGPVTLLDYSHLPDTGLTFRPRRSEAPLQWLPVH